MPEIPNLPVTQVARITSSHGNGFFDVTDGVVVWDNFDESEWPFEHHPLIINIAELAMTYGTLDFDREWDILDLGYICVNGTYEPPAEDWRMDGAYLPGWERNA